MPARPGPPRPLARAAVKSGICLFIMAAAIGAGMLLPDDSPGPGPDPWAGQIILLAVSGIWTAVGIMGCAVLASWEQNPPRAAAARPGPGGQALEAERFGGTGHGPVPPGPRTDQTRADLRARKSRQHRQRTPTRAGRAPRGIRPAQGAV